MGKINVTLSPLIGNYVDNIKAIEFPSIPFLEVASPIDDGGGEVAKEVIDQRKKDQEELEKAQGSLKVSQ